MRKIGFIIAIIIEIIFVNCISVFRGGMDFWKDIALDIIIFNIIITIFIIFISKKSKDNIKNISKKLIIFLGIFIVIKMAIIVYEFVYTKKVTDDIVNMHSATFLENINSFDELYNALNISDKEKELLVDNEDAHEDWFKLLEKNPINFVIYFSPLNERLTITSSRIIWLSNINNSKNNYRNSFEKYKKNYISEDDAVNQITVEREEYIQHLSVLFIITTFFEIMWLIVLIKIKTKEN